ncbi:NPL4 [Ecytonucleospora hepatopenaei]|uniref:Nuclear protein localization protein 4 n=1 Tax=Ecytonucleospora hepatopenaei TaxID=646526 RepID=A0A1W0E468_9MICR|nr:NPL4 [Ecytonucleospora hepatopenaei]
MTTVFVYGPWGRLPLGAEGYDDLFEKVKKHLKVENCIFYTDKQRTIEFKKEDQMKQGMNLYVVTDKIEKKEVTANLCQHPADKKCINCVQKEIFATEDNKKKEKYITFDTYKQMLEQKGEKMPDFDYIKKICKDHPANVTCIKCLDKAITLMPQIYRHVDYVEFESPFYVENMVNEWRGKQKQQFGLLLGKYKQVDEKERAVVSTIFIPKQTSFPDGIHIEELENPPFTGLEILGAIYTDLFLKEGKQTSYKISNDIFLSAFELEFFYKIILELSKNKKEFKINKEKFVFMCLTPDSEMQITNNCFLPTKQFYAVMDGNLLGLSTDCSTFVNTSKRELLYMYRNEYNLDVSTKADPFVPVEYFFVTCEAGYAKKESKDILFKNTDLKQILISLEKLSGYFEGEYHDFEKYQNFYLLLSIKQFYENSQELFNCVIEKDIEKFYTICNSSDFIKFIEKLEKHKIEKWNCVACTFLNDAILTQCDMCGTPKG